MAIGWRITKSWTLLLTLLALVVVTRPCHAQDTRTIRIILPFAAGGLSDAIARLAAERLATVLGQTVIVEPRPGGGGLIASKSVLAAPADGTTLLITGPSQILILPRVSRMEFDPVKEFVPVSNLGSSPLVLAINSSLPARNLAEFLKLAKESPGKLTYGSGGAATTTHLVAALFFNQAGIELTHVPYKGGAPAVTDLIAGHVNAYFGNPTDIAPQMAGGKIRVLGISDDKRSREFPDVPAISETYPGFKLLNWNALFARAGTPQVTVGRISKALQEISREPDYAARIQKLGVDVSGAPAAEFADTLRKDAALWDAAVKAANITRE
jgi:tripartite-type tricarboxylate transporter receptor subunit TctC